MKIAKSQRRQFESRLSGAEMSTSLLLRQLRGLFDDMVAVDYTPDQVTRARFDGWLDALHVVAVSEALTGHDALREALLNELETYALNSPLGLPPSVDAVDPQGRSEHKLPTRANSSSSDPNGVPPPPAEEPAK